MISIAGEMTSTAALTDRQTLLSRYCIPNYDYRARYYLRPQREGDKRREKNNCKLQIRLFVVWNAEHLTPSPGSN